jgi:anaerobic C4-dicarboxylate transporter
MVPFKTYLWRYPTPQDFGICKETTVKQMRHCSMVNFSSTACAVVCRSLNNRITFCTVKMDTLYSSRLPVHSGIFQTAQEQIQKDHNFESNTWHTSYINVWQWCSAVSDIITNGVWGEPSVTCPLHQMYKSSNILWHVWMGKMMGK